MTPDEFNEISKVFTYEILSSKFPLHQIETLLGGICLSMHVVPARFLKFELDELVCIVNFDRNLNGDFIGDYSLRLKTPEHAVIIKLIL